VTRLLTNAKRKRKMIDIEATLIERGDRYGTFEGHAEISQHLKGIIRKYEAERACDLSADQREALEMVCHKIARIINGDPDYVDSWIDIAGYSKLIADRLQGNGK
jgi:hypothetical protein